MASSDRTTEETPALPSSGIVWGLAAAVIWGAWPVLSRAGVSGENALTPMDITALRFGVAGLVLLPLLFRNREKAPMPPWPAMLLMTLGAGVPYVMTATIGLSMAPATHAGIIIPSTMLTCTALGGWLFLKDRPSMMRIFGIAVILLGIAITGSRGVLGTTGAADYVIGDLLFMASGFLWAVYTVSARRWGVDPWRATAIVSVGSLVAFAPIYAVTADWAHLGTLPLELIAIQAIGQGIGAAILALVFYSKAVASLGAAKGALFAALVPGMAAALALPILNERPAINEIAGLAVVTVAMIVALRAR